MQNVDKTLRKWIDHNTTATPFACHEHRNCQKPPSTYRWMANEGTKKGIKVNNRYSNALTIEISKKKPALKTVIGLSDSHSAVAADLRAEHLRRGYRHYTDWLQMTLQVLSVLASFGFERSQSVVACQ